jgi:8-oxo-dGTP pyrophosphatase MutT (NUDIX family)
MSWKILKQEYIEKNKWINLRKDTCKVNNKIIDDYYVLEMQDVSCVVAITKENKLLLVKEYKHAVQKEILQLPCGYVDAGEKPLDTAKRELAEETGYISEQWTFCGVCAGSPGRLTHHYYFFLAENCEKKQQQHLDDIETLKVLECPLNEVSELMKKSSIDMTLATGLFLTKERREK